MGTAMEVLVNGKAVSLPEAVNLTALKASGAEIITVAIRRVNLGQHADEAKLVTRF